MPQGKGTYGSKAGRPPKKKTTAKPKKSARRITQEEVEARIKAANKKAKNMTPSPAMQKKMAEQMRNAKMDAKMKAAAKRHGMPTKKKKKKDTKK